MAEDGILYRRSALVFISNSLSCPHVGYKDSELPTDLWPEEDHARMEEEEGQRGRGWFSKICFLRVLEVFSSSFTSKETGAQRSPVPSPWPHSRTVPEPLAACDQCSSRSAAHCPTDGTEGSEWPARATRCSEQLQGPCWHCSRI